jgi:hypothetical protein
MLNRTHAFENCLMLAREFEAEAFRFPRRKKWCKVNLQCADEWRNYAIAWASN